MSHRTGTYVLLLLVAGLSTGALEPKPMPPPLELEEYLEADDWFQEGISLNSVGRYREAAEAFAKSLAIEPKNPLSWLNMGTAQALEGDYPHAIEALQRSVRLDPKLALGFANLAEVCFRTDRFQEAVEAYTALLALWPHNPNALYKRGLAYLLLNDTGKAQGEYLALKVVDPELAEKLREAIKRATAH